MGLFRISAVAGLMLGCAIVPPAEAAGPAAAAPGACPVLLNHTVPSLLDQPSGLCQFQGKVLLVVNTASKCGFTPQYEGLEKLYKRYKDRGLVVMGFPSDDFGGQEPGSNKEIADFCQANFGVSFPMFTKTKVSGKSPHPFYVQLAKASGSRPSWTFHKYLIDRRGEKVLAFDSGVTPSDSKLIGEVERLLAAK